MKRLALGLWLALLAGCAAQSLVYDKAGVTAADRQQDESRARTHRYRPLLARQIARTLPHLPCGWLGPVSPPPWPASL